MHKADPKVLTSLIMGEMSLTRPATKEELMQKTRDEVILEILDEIHDLHDKINKGEIELNCVVDELEKLTERVKVKIRKIGDE